MFGNKKNEKPKRDRAGRNLAQYGLFDMSNNYGAAPDDDNDSDLEAELSNLVGGNGPNKRQAPPKKIIPDADLNAMVAESMKDIPSDAELSDDDDDPDLLNELNEITGGSGMDTSIPVASPNQADDGGSDLVRLLSERLKMYEVAEKNAQASGESSRARRFHRGLNTIQDMLKQARAGRNVNQDEIPPEVATGPRKPADADGAAAAATPSRPAPSAPVPEPVKPATPEPIPVPEPEETAPEEAVDSPPSPPAKPNVDVALVNMLQGKKKQFKIAALKAKKSGDTATALSYIKIAKQFDQVIAAAESGQPVDLNRMPDPPPDPAAAASKIEENQTQADSDAQPQQPQSIVEETAPEALVMASSVGEALEQRLEIYMKQEKAAEEAGNSSKKRRMGRIVKQYEQAIKLHKAGKPIPVEDLPTPPGYGPIPVPGAEMPKAATSEPPTPSMPEAAPAKQTPSPEAQPKTPPSRPSTSQSTRIHGNLVPNSRADKQLVLLLAKQKEFKLAALHAKQKGEIEQAKEFLRTAKRFDPLIDAANCGLPVDLSTIPVSPSAKSQLDDEYDVVMADDCKDEDKSENADVISRLESQLTKQLKMCLSTRDHHKALGDVGGTNRFERLALNVTKDLDLVRLAHRTPGARVPKFHYETRDFSIVKSFTELNDNDLELTILRGISYTCANPKEIDTYVKFEFPFPQETPFGDRTATVRDTNSPEYNATFTLPIQRTARACQRVFKRHPIKFEIYSKGGFFRGDTLIGTVNVKLQPLETQCELHESFDLLDGRKKVGGKLEVRLRLRHPIVSQQVEQLHEKWLVIDN